MVRFTLVLLAAVALSSCSMNDCCSSFFAFDGITETDEEGTLVGEEDPDDWQVGSGSDGGASTVIVRPAFPNPATGESFVEVVLTEPDTLRITVQRENSDNPVVTVLTDGALAAGVHRLRIDRPASAPGLFQIVVQGSTFSTVGDVRFE